MRRSIQVCAGLLAAVLGGGALLGLGSSCDLAAAIPPALLSAASPDTGDSGSVSGDETSPVGVDSGGGAHDTGPCAREVVVGTLGPTDSIGVDWRDLTVDAHGDAMDPSSDVTSLTAAVIRLSAEEYADAVCREAVQTQDVGAFVSVAVAGTSHVLSLVQPPDVGSVLWVTVFDSSGTVRGGAASEIVSGSDVVNVSITTESYTIKD